METTHYQAEFHPATKTTAVKLRRLMLSSETSYPGIMHGADICLQIFEYF